MARLPSVVDFGGRPTPSGGRSIVPVRTGIAEQAQAETGRAVQRSGQQTFEFGSDFGAAEGRRRTKEDVVEQVRSENVYLEAAAAELRRVETEDDLSKVDTTNTYGAFLSQKRDEVLAGYRGSPLSKLDLMAKLEAARGRYVGRAGIMGADAQDKIVTDTLGERINGLVKNVFSDPYSLNDVIASLDQTIDQMGPALKPDQERAFRNAGRERLVEGTMDAYFAKGDIDQAERVLNTPGMEGAVSAQGRIRLQGRVLSAREERGKFMRQAQEKLAAAEFLKGSALTPGERLNLAGVARVPEQARDEFNRNLDELMEMEKNGEQGTPRYNLMAQRVQRQTQSNQQGLSIQFNPDGTVSAITQGPAAGLGSKLTGSQALQEKAQVDRLGTVIDLIDTTVGQIREKPGRAGVTGELASFAQKIVGVAGDIAPEQLAAAVGKTAAQFGLGSYFDPKLPESEIYENTIALELAKMRVTAGGGGIRAVESAFKAAKNDVKLRGLTSSQEVVTRLETVRREFDVERNKLTQRLSGAPPQPGPAVNEGQTATNPKTGEKMIFRGGRWEKAQ
jgi:hypothetical protein